MHIWHSHMKYIPSVAVGKSVVNHVTWCKIMQCLVFIFPLASRWMEASSLNCPNYSGGVSDVQELQANFPKWLPEGPFFMEKSCPELPWASKLSLHCLTKVDEPLTWETKSWLGQKGDPPSWVTLFRYKHFESSSRVNLVKARRSECARALLSL